MKGDRNQPQCGFSATVVGILDELLDEYVTINVLADAEIREGIKAFSSWPTIPQLYVGGKFVGGSDIVREMDEAGELGETLGAQPKPEMIPEITVSDAAMTALKNYHDGEGPLTFRIRVSPRFQYEMDFDSPTPKDLQIEAASCTLIVDKSSARRTDGMSIDFVETATGGGFKMENPNEPPRVRNMAPAELAQRMKEGAPMRIFDVRTPEERQTASIQGTTLLDDAGRTLLEKLDRHTPLVLLCHHGMRSQVAAEHCLRMGFTDVHNLVGGIDAWSTEVDSTVPRY